MTESDHIQRSTSATDSFAGHKLDALLVSSLPNVRYLSGFTGSNALLVLLPGSAVLFVDSRYKLQAETETACTVRVVHGSLHLGFVKWLKGKGSWRIGFDPKHVTHAAFLSLKGAARFVPVAGLVEELRMVKSPAELDIIRAAVLLASKAYARTLRLIRPGLSEQEVAADLDHRMRKLGAERSAFDTIVASGSRTAFPHASPTSKTLLSNELLLVDMGAVRDGYSSDMTRTVFIGRPGRKVRQLYAAVLEAQSAAIASVREGVPAAAVDRAARRVLRAHKLDGAFVHACGHGLGLEIHEPPRLGKPEKIRLQAGMAITVEPGVYLRGFGGIRIEDTVVVTRNGCEVLTPSSKEFLAI